jgi:DNA-directed RNA polymerase specialized sigma24 family protein
LKNLNGLSENSAQLPGELRSNGELAEMFGQEKNNIAVRLHRIRQALQAEMER